MSVTSRRTRTRAALSTIVRSAGPSTGFRASGLLLGGVVANIGGAYAYNLLCIRWLGARAYADVAALTAISTILLLPLLGVQAALAREVAAFSANDAALANAALLKRVVRRTFLFIGLGCAVLLLASPLIRYVLKIDDLASVVAMTFFVGVAAAIPVLQGFLTGLERFRRIAVALVVYGFGRPLFAIPLILAGLGVAGAISAATIAGVVAIAIALAALRDLFSTGDDAPVDLELRGFAPVVVGLLAFTGLMNLDIIAAKVFLSSQDAGTYAAASLVGKVAALVPAGAIAPVLLPRATGRIERGENPARIVAASLVATIGFGLLLTLALFGVPTSVVEWTFGEEFSPARDLLAPCAAAMTLCGIINVNLTFAFALRDRALVKMLCLAVGADVALLALLHDSAYEILAATAIASGGAIVWHEISSPAAMWRLLRTP